MLHSIRKNYQLAALTEADAASDPSLQLDNWLQQALNSDEEEPTAMVVSTVDSKMQPHSRVVLLKELTAEGLVFYTNYAGNKGTQLAQNPRVSVLFFWQSLERQVRITGTAEKIAEAISDAYFQSRPPESRLGAWVSEQSAVIPSTEYLMERFDTFRQQFGETIPRPPHWGGYLIKPTTFEFWQGRPGRLHDRLFYSFESESGSWKVERLAP
jgi:pyridoxamine 5'-phosphate oxidase